MRLSFIKCHGSGNDFPLIDARAITLSDAEWAAAARALADRAGPVGGDGLLALLAPAPGVLQMRMWNPDGSEAETCLNGLRCVARAGFEALGLREAPVRLKASDAEVALDPPLAAGVVTVRETVGPADLNARWVAGAERIVDAPIAPLASDRRFTAVAMPNPHLIAFVDRVDEAELVAVGTVCEAAPAWLPGRANVSFVEQRGEDLFVRTFERGVGLTNSCGSAMAAASFAACFTGRLAYDVPLKVFNAGGLVRALVAPDGRVTLSGNATFEWAGSAEVDFATARAGDLVIDRHFTDEIAAWSALVDTLPR